MLKGEVCCIFNQVQSVLPQYRAGKVRLLGASPTSKRVPVIPEVPTIAENGVPGFNSTIWFGFFGPKGAGPEDRAQDQRCGEGRAGKPGHSPEADRRGQFAACGKRGPVPCDGEGGSAEVGGGGEDGSASID
ncbi:tripartite tricarboxylate transporter substrate-binding protein [Cupriavidus basilensis]